MWNYFLSVKWMHFFCIILTLLLHASQTHVTSHGESKHRHRDKCEEWIRAACRVTWTVGGGGWRGSAKVRLAFQEWHQTVAAFVGAEAWLKNDKLQTILFHRRIFISELAISNGRKLAIFLNIFEPKHTHLTNEAFVGVLGSCRCGFMTLLVVWSYLYTMNLQKRSLERDWSPFRPLKVGDERGGSVWITIKKSVVPSLPPSRGACMQVVFVRVPEEYYHRVFTANYSRASWGNR